MSGEGLQAICSVRGAQPCGQRLRLRDLRTHFICVFTVSSKCQGLCPMGGWSNYKALYSYVSVMKARFLRRCLSKGLVSLLYNTSSQAGARQIVWKLSFFFFTKFKRDNRSEGPWRNAQATELLKPPPPPPTLFPGIVHLWRESASPRPPTRPCISRAGKSSVCMRACVSSRASLCSCAFTCIPGTMGLSDK